MQKERVLAVDYGDKRTGLAISDATGFLASGIGTISSGGMKHTAAMVAAEAEKREATMIVVGLPRNMDGSYGFRAETVRSFIALLALETSLPIETYDERLTTVVAHTYLSITDSKKRKKTVDTLSAELILQDFLDRKRNISKK